MDSLVDGVLTFVKSEPAKEGDDKFVIDTKRDIRRLDKIAEPARDFKPKMTLAERYIFLILPHGFFVAESQTNEKDHQKMLIQYLTCNVRIIQGGKHVLIQERESTGESRPVPPRSEVQGSQG